jgi:putative glutamine amidotransferase
MSDDSRLMPDDARVMSDDAGGMPDDARLMPDDARLMPDDARGMPDDARLMPDDARGMPDDARGMPDEGRRNGRRPLIGISGAFHDFGDYGGVGVQRPVLAAGGLPVTLPQLPDAIEPALDVLDGVILAPGRDIEPRRYGQEPHELLAATDPQRDAFELALAERALERGLPILGMCRGVQLLNVALGGTLAQDVSLLVNDHPTDPGWRAWKRVEKASLTEAPVPEHPRHQISISPGSLLAEALGTTTIDVSSFHHQAIDRLGEGLAVVATAPDGVPEAIELPGRPVLAVQWELQEEWRVDPRFLKVFTWFVESCFR